MYSCHGFFLCVTSERGGGGELLQEEEEEESYRTTAAGGRGGGILTSSSTSSSSGIYPSSSSLFHPERLYMRVQMMKVIERKRRGFIDVSPSSRHQRFLKVSVMELKG